MSAVQEFNYKLGEMARRKKLQELEQQPAGNTFMNWNTDGGPFDPPAVKANFQTWDKTADRDSFYAPKAPVRDTKRESSKALQNAVVTSLVALLAGEGDSIPALAAASLSGSQRGDDRRYKSALDQFDAETKRLKHNFDIADRQIDTDNQANRNKVGAAATVAGVARQGAEARDRGAVRQFNMKLGEDRQKLAQDKFQAGIEQNQGRDQNKFLTSLVGLPREAVGNLVRAAHTSGELKRLGLESVFLDENGGVVIPGAPGSMPYPSQSAKNNHSADVLKLAGEYLRMAENPRTNADTRKWALEERGRLLKSIGYGSTDVDGNPKIGPGGVGGVTPAEVEANRDRDRKHAESIRQWAAKHKLDLAKFTAADKKAVATAVRAGRLEKLAFDKFEYQKKKDAGKGPSVEIQNIDTRLDEIERGKAAERAGRAKLTGREPDYQLRLERSNDRTTTLYEESQRLIKRRATLSAKVPGGIPRSTEANKKPVPAPPGAGKWRKTKSGVEYKQTSGYTSDGRRWEVKDTD